ncbi:HAMP domain-containing histidine kinase [Clostridium sp. SHJSY1]|uniref:sensor histidine kinase n=1 Tax=Clostridium sp. SHJSY1 TaxID=2942483 RepID=UPI002876EE42|nr:HAMP domain-containing sensor histidine kinase [Clostridium sp. SHJSY1]MDS0527267.1 HAMP domain-containing histidine kinase [Clostridium sp. SHJSY1]
MYLLVIILLMISIFAVAIFIKLFSYRKQIEKITWQVKEFRLRETNKKINIEMQDKYIENLAFEINEYLELYKRNEQEKVLFENSLKQGISNMSHDLRTPLTSIIGYLKLLQKDEISKDEALDILKNKTNKLNILINDFFELASIENVDYELNLSKINLSNLVSDEVLSLYESFENKGLIPQITIPDKPIFIMGNKDSIERIIDNLLSNTLKYAEKDIALTLEKFDDKVIFTVSNISTSIEEKDIIHMFDRFYMADKVRKDQSTGLGLSIVKSLMEKMDGSITSTLEGNRLFIICKFPILNE